MQNIVGQDWLQCSDVGENVAVYYVKFYYLFKFGNALICTYFNSHVGFADVHMSYTRYISIKQAPTVFNSLP
jgi:hypothetical protein